MGREYELKFRADPDTLQAIRAKFGDFTPITMATTYFDTPDLALGRRRWTLRRRLENGVSVCTAKVPLPDGSRGEWEVSCLTIQEAVPELCKLGAPEELLALPQLQASCGARFTRLSSQLHLPGCTVELDLDQGVLLGGGRELPFAEVEVELKDGSELTCTAFAQALAREFVLAPEPKSKLQRALALAAPQP